MLTDYMIWRADKDESTFEVFEGNGPAEAIETWASEQEDDVDGDLVCAREARRVSLGVYVAKEGGRMWTVELEAQTTYKAVHIQEEKANG